MGLSCLLVAGEALPSTEVYVFFSVKPYRKAVQPSTAEVRRGCTVSALGPLLATVYNTVYRIRLATRFGSYLSHEKETKTGPHPRDE